MPAKNLSRKHGRSISALNSSIQDLKSQNHVASPSRSISVKATCIGDASPPVAPKRTVFGSTPAGSKPLTLKIATLIFLVLLGLILLASVLGLMSTKTTILPPGNSTEPRTQTPETRVSELVGCWAGVRIGGIYRGTIRKKRKIAPV